MKRTVRLMIALGCMALLVSSWAIVLGAKSADDKQAELLAQAKAYTDDKVYILAVPFLEEAADIGAENTPAAETALKEAYLELFGQPEYRNRYIGLLEKQMDRKDAPPHVYIEAASFHLDGGRYDEAFDAFRRGIEKTGSEDIINEYEQCRYKYFNGYTTYEDVKPIHEKTLGVQKDGLWGIVTLEGKTIIPCEYEKISVFSGDRAIVKKDDEIYAIDQYNNRLALLKETVYDFGNYAGDRIAILTDDGWKRATGDFQIGTMAFEQIGTYSGEHAAAKQDGKWGLIDMSSTWLVPAEYDELMMDELGRSYAQGAAFAKKGDGVYLIINGEQTGEAYEDAKPFGDEGYAAVKKGGLWGYINNSGELMIDYQFEEALSFGQHLAAVKQDGLWGYISLYGKMAIEAEYLQAKSFADGAAPVLTDQGWILITLYEA